MNDIIIGIPREIQNAIGCFGQYYVVYPLHQKSSALAVSTSALENRHAEDRGKELGCLRIKGGAGKVEATISDKFGAIASLAIKCRELRFR